MGASDGAFEVETNYPRPGASRVVSPKWLVFCGKGFSVQARRERRAYPEVDL